MKKNTKENKLIWEAFTKIDSVDSEELKMGIADEKEEHGLTDEEAEKVARDHLTKVHPKYYTKLKECGL